MVIDTLTDEADAAGPVSPKNTTPFVDSPAVPPASPPVAPQLQATFEEASPVGGQWAFAEGDGPVVVDDGVILDVDGCYVGRVQTPDVSSSPHVADDDLDADVAFDSDEELDLPDS